MATKATKKAEQKPEAQQPSAEEKPKSNPDYSSTVVNLCNPPAVLEALNYLHECEALADELKAKIEALDPELQKQYDAASTTVREALKALHELIDTQGSYQDIDAGLYALKYGRTFTNYKVEPFKAAFPKLVPLVVEEVVNVQALKGQLKAKTVTEEELRAKGCIDEELKHQYFVR